MLFCCRLLLLSLVVTIVVLYNIPVVRNMAYPWWVYISSWILLFIFILPSDNVSYMFQSVIKQIRWYRSKQASFQCPPAVTIKTKVLCSVTTLSGRPQPQNICINVNSKIAHNVISGKLIRTIRGTRYQVFDTTTGIKLDPKAWVRFQKHHGHFP